MKIRSDYFNSNHMLVELSNYLFFFPISGTYRFLSPRSPIKTSDSITQVPKLIVAIKGLISSILAIYTDLSQLATEVSGMKSVEYFEF